MTRSPTSSCCSVPTSAAIVRDAYEPSLAQGRLSQLALLQAAAISLNLELTFQVRLPEPVVRRHLPRHAVSLLPRSLSRQLRALASDPARALEGVERAVVELGVEHAKAADAQDLLDRVQVSEWVSEQVSE